VGNLKVNGDSNQWFSTRSAIRGIAGSCTASSVFGCRSPRRASSTSATCPHAIYGPSFYTTDLSLVKNTERWAEPRCRSGRSVRLFNHANLASPDAFAPGAGLGVITNTRFPTATRVRRARSSFRRTLF